MKGYEEELEAALDREALQSGEGAKIYIQREMDLARKNITQKYLRLFRLILRIRASCAPDTKTF